MIIIKKNKIYTNTHSVPVLMVFEEDPVKAGKKGTILFYHGLTAKKETNLKELRSFAERGFLAIGVDNVGHGERRFADFDQRMKNPDFEKNFIDMVRQTSEEVPLLVDGLIKMGVIIPHRVGVCGISMGGFITYGGILADKRLKVATPILGSPRWNCNKESPHHHPERFYPVALLSQNAGLDQSVPPQSAREFHERLNPFYMESPDRIKYVEYPHSGHFMLEEDWNRLWETTLNWFDNFLPPQE